VRRRAGDERPGGGPRAVPDRKRADRHRLHARGSHLRAARHRAKRSPFDPDIPTIAEQGFPGYAATNWYAVVVSSKTPTEIVAMLNAILTKALGAPEVRTAYGQQGMETLASTADEAANHIARETGIWKKVIADTGIRLE
jgi:tripartite-type tricarboxylate transporter receptor subunit TctC